MYLAHTPSRAHAFRSGYNPYAKYRNMQAWLTERNLPSFDDKSAIAKQRRYAAASSEAPSNKAAATVVSLYTIEPLVAAAARLGKALSRDVGCPTATAERATWARANRGNEPAAARYATHCDAMRMIEPLVAAAARLGKALPSDVGCPTATAERAAWACANRGVPEAARYASHCKIEPLVAAAARLGKALPSDVGCPTATAERATWARANRGNVPEAARYATHCDAMRTIEPLVAAAARLGKALPSDVACPTATADRAAWARANRGNVPEAARYATHCDAGGRQIRQRQRERQSFGGSRGGLSRVLAFPLCSLSLFSLAFRLSLALSLSRSV